MEAAHTDSYTLGLPLSGADLRIYISGYIPVPRHASRRPGVERAYEFTSRGIYQSLDTLVAGQVYDLVNACHRYHDIFVVLKHNFLTLYKVILLPRRCHENLKKI